MMGMMDPMMGCQVWDPMMGHDHGTMMMGMMGNDGTRSNDDGNGPYDGNDGTRSNDDGNE